MGETLTKLKALLARRDKIRFGGLLVLMVVASLLEMLGIGVIPAFVAAVADPDRIMQYPTVRSVLTTLGITTARQLLLWGAIALIAVYLFKNAFLILVSYVQARFTYRYQARLRHRLFSAYMTAPYTFHLNRNTAELLRNVNTDASRVIRDVINPFLTLVMNGLMTLFILALVIVFKPVVALISLGLLGTSSVLFLRSVRQRISAYGKEAQHQNRVSIQAVNQGLGGLRDARVLGREAYFIDTFRRSADRFAVAERVRQFTSRLAVPVLEFLAVSGLLLIALALVLMGENIASIVPTLVLFGVAIVRLRATVSTCVQQYANLRYTEVALDPIYHDLEALAGTAAATPTPEASPAPPLRFDQAITIEDVSYRYPEAHAPALEGIQLAIPKGSSAAFVGATGAGKTTMVNVLLGLLKPQHGAVRVDGTDIQTNLRGWQARVGYISQSIYLLDDTIRRNVAFGLEDDAIDEDRLQAALRAAQLWSFVHGLEQGVDTMTGERGIRLSGGQQQRIGIARALYHNPEVLVMDEATSSLDTLTERSVIRALEHLKDNRTVIMIAHRLSTVRDCDRLYFMREGRIEAAGTYEELYHSHGAFQQMAAVA